MFSVCNFFLCKIEVFIFTFDLMANPKGDGVGKGKGKKGLLNKDRS